MCQGLIFERLILSVYINESLFDCKERLAGKCVVVYWLVLGAEAR